MKHNAVQAMYATASATTNIIASLVAAELGASRTELGLIGAAFGVSTLLSHYVFGRAADKHDRRKFILMGTLTSAVAVAGGAYAFDVPSFAAVRFLQGFTFGVIPAALAVFVYELKRPLGKFTSYGSLGWIFGSLIVMGVPFLASRLGIGSYDLIFFVSAMPMLLCFWFALEFPSKKAGLAVPFFPVNVIRGSASVYVPMVMRHTGATAIWVIFPLFIIGPLGGSLADVGIIHFINVATQFLILQNVERLPLLSHPRVLVPVGLVTSAATFFGFTLSRSVYELAAWQVLLGVSWATLWLGCLKHALETNIERATATGLLNSSVSMSNVVGPLLGGVLAQRYGFESTMWFAGILSLLAVPVHRLLLKVPAPLPVPAALTSPGEMR